VGDWLSVPINRVAMLLEPGDTDDDDEEEADIDVDDFLYGYCPGANGGGGGAFVPSEVWYEDKLIAKLFSDFVALCPLSLANLLFTAFVYELK